MEALDLINPNWHAITSGNKVNISESQSGRYNITQPCKPNPPDHPEPASKHCGSRACGVSSHGPCSLPLPQINGLPSVAQILSQCPPTGCMFDDDCHVEMDGMLTQKRKKADSLLENSTLGDRIAHNGLETLPQEMYLNDSLSFMSPTKGSSYLSQDANAAAYTLHSTSSALAKTAVETLAYESTDAIKRSPCSDEYISSNDESDIVEVPIANTECKTPPHCSSQSGSVIVHEIRHERGNSSSARQEVAGYSQMGCSPENVYNFHVLDEPALENEVIYDSKSLLSWIESVSIPLIPQDSDQDTNFAFPKIFPSTLDADNPSVLKPSPSGTSSSLPSRPRKTLASKSRKRTKPRPKTSTSKKRVRALTGNKSKARTTKRRCRKPRSSMTSSMFSPQELEINLKYANQKDNKKDAKSDSFAPYIQMKFSSCTIINFREEDDASMKKGSPQLTVSGVIPKTLCLQLGRVGCNARFHHKHLCCLCGRAPNGEGLGDLYGPYYPSGAQPLCKSDNSPPTRRQDPNCSDLDSVYSLEDDGSQSIIEADLLEIGAKQSRNENCVEIVEKSGVCSERWIHEDCSIWTAGVFLVKGRLYGLEEAIWLAQEMVCSYCHRVGATLGCFFKDCPNKYHFPCALQSDSALNEENFTIRCPKHKNKASRMSVSRVKNR
ncbi:transcription factor 20-like [Xyrauchen texanus]|uniref:transcription factor 20-like n=1 Tax=Xyrauchen texanus TaxID=154827 RepID=UPI0022421399|nr:transcription factor 20-like [Xyrauchen texanus]